MMWMAAVCTVVFVDRVRIAACGVGAQCTIETG